MTRSGGTHPVVHEPVAVIVVTFNSRDLVLDLATSLVDGCAGVRWRLYVVDNASADGTPELVASLIPGAELIQMGRNAGYAAGVNAGIRAAKDAGAYLILNPDVRLDPGCLRTLLAAAAEPGVGIAVPRLRDAQGELILSMRREPTIVRALADLVAGAERAGRIGSLGEMVGNRDLYAAPAQAEWAEGSTQLVTRQCAEAVGAWDESYFLYSEEADFDLRAGELGFQVRYEPSASAVHLEGGSAGSARLWPLVQSNKVRFYARRHGRVSTAIFWLIVLLREGSRAAVGRRRNWLAARRLLSVRRMREQPGPWSLEGSI